MLLAIFCKQILLFGTAVYNGSVWTFSDMSYEQLSTEENEQVQAGGIIKTEASMASPSISRYSRICCLLSVYFVQCFMIWLLLFCAVQLFDQPAGST